MCHWGSTRLKTFSPGMDDLQSSFINKKHRSLRIAWEFMYCHIDLVTAHTKENGLSALDLTVLIVFGSVGDGGTKNLLRTEWNTNLHRTPQSAWHGTKAPRRFILRPNLVAPRGRTSAYINEAL